MPDQEKIVDDSPYAFPQPVVLIDGMPQCPSGRFEAGGMSLQQWYAGQALIGAMSNPATIDLPTEKIARWAAHCARALWEQTG